jgi:hypothetical protein
LSSPVLPLGRFPLFLPSVPCPLVFWNETYQKTTSSGDPLFYQSLNESISDRLTNYVKIGKLPNLAENSFFLICDDYFNTIINVISVGQDFLTFQLRGLEIHERTLCHINELGIVRSGIDAMEMKKLLL